MRTTNINHNVISHLTNLSIEELRREWAMAWSQEPRLTVDQQKRLDQLIKQYKRNPNCFDKNIPALKPGTRLVRNWNGTRHSVLVQTVGYEYRGKIYGSLSQIASEITGTRWNGWVFFGLKKKEIPK